MNKYNQLMLKFWLIVSIILPLVITYFVITDGFKKWGQYYVLAIFTFLMYIVRRWMMKRMEKHLEFLKEQSK
jgi:hypothetical protein